jgi:integrase
LQADDRGERVAGDIQEGVRRARVPNAHIHRFRRTFAFALRQKGVSIEIVSVLLAQSSIRVTERHHSP